MLVKAKTFFITWFVIFLIMCVFGLWVAYFQEIIEFSIAIINSFNGDFEPAIYVSLIFSFVLTVIFTVMTAKHL